jgi:hypothetical protein
MKHSKVFVVLTDKNFLEHFKSLYYSAITIGKWDGDFVVIVPESDKDEIDEEKFKGVKFFYGKTLEDTPRPHYYKYYLFDEYFKQWDWIFYCDLDVLFFNEIDLDLDNRKKDVMYANDCNYSPLCYQFEYRPQERKKFNKKQMERYEWMRENWMSTPSFQTCFMLFHKDMITTDRFDRLLDLHKEWYIELDLCIHGLTEEQSIINVEFIDNWEPLGENFVNVYQRANELEWEYEKIIQPYYDENEYTEKGIIAQHFFQFFQPWSLHNVRFYNVYRENLKGFETL